MRTIVVAAFLISVTPLFAQGRSWLDRVPEHDRVRPNPLASDANAIAAGAILYRRDCASCHGQTARGLGSHPSLHSNRVQTATDGDLHWLLTNGDLRHGMPSWSRLPDMQRWQIVRYLHALPLTNP